MSKIINVLYGYRGHIVVMDNNTAIVQERGEPHIEIPMSKLQTYIEKLAIHSTSNGDIKLGIWEA